MRSFFTFAVVAIVGCREPDGERVALPGGSPGIGFDDLRYSAALDRVLAPGGRSGNLYLIAPDSLEIESIGGFSTEEAYDGGHDFGATSVDEGGGRLYVTDRTTRTLFVVDPASRAIVGQAPLAAGPDYVRWVEKTRELWVTEPSGDQLEIFALPEGAVDPVSVAVIPVDNGPESLVIDQRAGRAYTHRWQESSLVFDVVSRALLAEWPNGCAASRGLAIDAERGFFFVDCSEGTVSVLDTRDGHVLSTEARGSGFDVLGYDEALQHLYVAGGACGCLVVFGVSAQGALSFLERFDAPASTHCATADQQGHAWVCDPDEGQLWRVNDDAP
jgi:DNA-binding beta-propeller fold protein YncE